MMYNTHRDIPRSVLTQQDNTKAITSEPIVLLTALSNVNSKLNLSVHSKFMTMMSQFY